MLFLILFVVVVMSATDNSDHEVTGSADDRHLRHEVLQQHHATENEAHRSDAVRALFRERVKVHERHMHEHRLEDPDEHPDDNLEVRQAFVRSRRNAMLVSGPATTPLDVCLISVLVTLPLAIVFMWLRL